MMAASLLVPPRARGVEILDDPTVDAAVRERSLEDVARANALFGGTSAVLAELQLVLGDWTGARMTMLDAGSGLGDIAARAREAAAKAGVELHAIGLDAAEALARATARRAGGGVCGDALALPFRDRCFDVVSCSQLLHHFADADAARLLCELNRVARVRVIVSDLLRHRLAVAGLWLASFPLRFHPVSRHDGVVSVLRGFTLEELKDSVVGAVGRVPDVRRRPGFRVTASWIPA